MANPLTLIMPLEAGVDLTKLAETIAGSAGKIDQALTNIGTVHFARFVVLDASAPNLNPGLGGKGPYQLAVITAYDGDFNSYIQEFVNQIGDIFNELLTFTADGQSLVPVQKNVAGFTAYVAKNDLSQQLPNSQLQLYSAYPCTVQQILAADPCPSLS